MPSVTWRAVVDDERLATLRRCRDDVVLETDDGPDRWCAADGPFDVWERTLEVEATGDGTWTVVEQTTYRLAIPYFRWLLALPVRHAVRRPRHDGRQPWWGPPARLDQRSASVLALMAALAMVAGYLGTLVGQTMTFAADEFGASDSAQGVALAVVRVGVALALILSVLADRRGRRIVLIGAATAGILMAATGALAPSLAWLTLSQVIGRSFATTLGTLVPIVAAEETPAGSRAWAMSILAMSGSLGAGMAVAALPLADLGETTWRLVYVVPLVAIPLVLDLRRRLPESRRFEARAAAPERPTGRLRDHRRRFVLLAITAFLVALMVAPAAQFRNEFLTDERGFSAAQLTLFIYAANTPAGIGVIAGGWLADRRGRRTIGGFALAVGAVLTAVSFNSSGVGLVAWAIASTVIGAMAIPALAVYGPELFPTSLRGRANGALTVIGTSGSVVGLVAAGQLSDRFGALGPGLALLSIGPVVAGILIIATYPETARRELEEINPEDAGLSPSPTPASRSPGPLP